MPKKGGGEKNGKKQHKKTKRTKKSDYYEVSAENVTKKRRECPKCGAGVFLGEYKETNKTRLHCGKCSYTEYLSTEK